MRKIKNFYELKDHISFVPNAEFSYSHLEQGGEGVVAGHQEYPIDDPGYVHIQELDEMLKENKIDIPNITHMIDDLQCACEGITCKYGSEFEHSYAVVNTDDEKLGFMWKGGTFKVPVSIEIKVNRINPAEIELPNGDTLEKMINTYTVGDYQKLAEFTKKLYGDVTCDDIRFVRQQGENKEMDDKLDRLNQIIDTPHYHNGGAQRLDNLKWEYTHMEEFSEAAYEQLINTAGQVSDSELSQEDLAEIKTLAGTPKEIDVKSNVDDFTKNVERISGLNHDYTL